MIKTKSEVSMAKCELPKSLSKNNERNKQVKRGQEQIQNEWEK